MRVYVVMAYMEYEAGWVHCVVSNEDKANELAKDLENNAECCDYTRVIPFDVDDQEDWTNYDFD